MNPDLFYQLVPNRASTRVDRAILFLAYIVKNSSKDFASLKDIEASFTRSFLPAPNVTILRDMLRRDKRAMILKDSARPRAEAFDFFNKLIPESLTEEPSFSSLPISLKISIAQTPMIGEEYIADLEPLTSLYAMLHTLENSMRRLVSKVLLSKYGDSWWEICSSAHQRRKHDDRLDKERKRQWLPARSSLGPLYSLDWTDLISLIRKHEVDFLPYIGEIEFLHRFNDLGLLRHVIAHNGFIEEMNSEIDRVRLALFDWQRQIGPTV